jgi:hypothetical protein
MEYADPTYIKSWVICYHWVEVKLNILRGQQFSTGVSPGPKKPTDLRQNPSTATC